MQILKQFLDFSEKYTSNKKLTSIIQCNKNVFFLKQFVSINIQYINSIYFFFIFEFSNQQNAEQYDCFFGFVPKAKISYNFIFFMVKLV